MSKIVIGVFGSNVRLGDVLRDFIEAGMDEQHLHMIGPPDTNPDVPTRTRFISDGELDRGRVDLEQLGLSSKEIEFYMQSLRKSASILAAEVTEEDQSKVVTMMHHAGAAHVDNLDTTNTAGDLAQKTVHTVEGAGESIRDSVENIWHDLKDAVQRVMS